MGKSIVILGAGTGGTIMANRLRRKYKADEASITIVDQNNEHIYQPGLLFVPFGVYTPEEIVRPRNKQVHAGIDYIQTSIESVDIEKDTVKLGNGSVLSYDVLIVATGAATLPDETEGLTGPGWRETMFDFYTLDGATALHDHLAHFEGGRVVINIMEMPIKCPVAPLEFTFLADWYFTEKGIRDKVDLVFVTPLDGAFTRPVATAALQSLLDAKKITIVPEFSTGEVDGNGGKIVSYDGREESFDLLVAIPIHGGAEYVGNSPGLGDVLNFVETDNHTLQAKCKPNVFAIGDATNLPTSKAGSVTHFEADVLAENIAKFLAGETLDSKFDGHANCFIETGFHKALLIDFNYETEPVPGRFPFGAGPLPLLKESRMNHLGKLMFHPMYWNMLLPGRNMPGIPTNMSMSGKQVPTESA